MKNLINKIKIILIVLFLSTVAVGLLSAQNGELFKVDKEISAAAHEASEKTTISFTIQIGLQKLYSVEKDVAYDVPFPDFRLFDDGSGVLIDAFEAGLAFYNNDGDEIAHLDMLKEKTVYYERSVYSAVAGGSLVIVLYQPSMDQLHVKRYSKNGQFIQQFSINEKHLNGISLSENENIIALSVYHWQKDLLNKSTLFLDMTGQQLARIEAGFTIGFFSNEAGRFLGYSNRDFFIYDLNDNTIQFSKSSQKGMMILAAQWYADQIITIEAEKPLLKNGRWYYQNPLYKRYALNGSLLEKTTIESKSFSEYELYSTKKGLIFRTENTIHQLVN